MKDEYKKYLESETKLNEHELHRREMFDKITIFLIILGLSGAIFGVYMALTV